LLSVAVRQARPPKDAEAAVTVATIPSTVRIRFTGAPWVRARNDLAEG
jgi:hypothetical protein